MDDQRHSPLDGVWIRRFVGSPPRLDEVVEMYEELGFEVKVEKASTEDFGGPECDTCEVTGDETSAVYTRRTAQ